MKIDRIKLIPATVPETPPPALTPPSSISQTAADIVDTPVQITTSEQSKQSDQRKQHIRLFLATWLGALKESLPVYVAIHIAFFVISCLALLLREKDFYGTKFPLNLLWRSWNHWDAGIYRSIAIHGYRQITDAAFFPLFPWVERAVLDVHKSTDTIIISLLYQLVLEDFGQEHAQRTLLYYALFPTAFFLATGYNESFFLCLTLLSFYCIRHGRWWLAGVFGLLACLTRETGIFLVLPFLYEYARQRDFQLQKMIRIHILAVFLIPAGIGLYCLYCVKRWGDPLAFIHAEANWDRHLQFPWFGFAQSIQSIAKAGMLSFQGLRNLTDLLPTLFILIVLILSVVGPWRLPKSKWAYSLYGLVFFVSLQLIASTGLYPLTSYGRFMLELFPAFIVMAAMGKQKWFHLNYMLISASILFFLTMEFLAGHWVL
jgi:Gpi18-like mannosyltransferase